MSLLIWSMEGQVERKCWTINRLGPRLPEWTRNDAQSGGELELKGNDGQYWVNGLQWGNENSCKSRTLQHKWGNGGAFSKGITSSDLNVQQLTYTIKQCHPDIHILNGQVNYSPLINSDFQMQYSQLFRYNRVVF